MNHKVRVTKRSTFEACHSLPRYDGKCSRLHGHSYKLEVTVSGVIDYEHMRDCEKSDRSVEAMVLDFSYLKSVIDKYVIDKLDHSNLNDWFDYPTAEIMTVWIYKTLSPFFNRATTVIESVKLWETEDSYSEYRGEKSEGGDRP